MKRSKIRYDWEGRAESLLRSLNPNREISLREIEETAAILRITGEIMDEIPFVEAS